MNANFYMGCILPWFSGPTPSALLDIRSLPLLGFNRWAGAIVSGDLRFQATAAVTSTGKRTDRESAAFNASVPERQIGLGVCSFDGNHKQWPVWGLQNHYIYINLGVLDWGGGSLKWPVFVAIWHQILDTRYHPISLYFDLIWMVMWSIDWWVLILFKVAFQGNICAVLIKWYVFILCHLSPRASLPDLLF